MIKVLNVISNAVGNGSERGITVDKDNPIHSSDLCIRKFKCYTFTESTNFFFLLVTGDIQMAMSRELYLET